MSELQDSQPASVPQTVPSRAEFLNLLALANGQFDADNRKEALALYLRARGLSDDRAGSHEAIFLARRIGECYQLRQESDQALVYLQEAETLLESCPDDVELAQVLAIRGSICTDRARFSTAQRLLNRAHELLKHRSEHRIFGTLLRRFGKLYLRMGRAQEARSYFESALATFRRIDDQRGIAGTLNNLGIIHRLSCEWIEAIRVMEKGLAINQILADEGQIAALCVNLGVVHLKLGQWQRAEVHLDRGVTSMGHTGNRRGLANALIAQASLAMRRRDWDRAESLLNEALEIAQRYDLVRPECLCYEFLGDLEIDRGRLEIAEQHLRRGLALARERTGASELVGELGRRLAVVLCGWGRLDEALELAEEAIQIDRKVSDAYEEALCHGTLARIHGLRGDGEALDRHADEAFERLTHFGERFEHAKLLLALADVYVENGDALRPDWRDQALSCYRRAETFFIGLEIPGYAAIASLKIARFEQANGSLDQALTRLDGVLGQLPSSETELVAEVTRLRAAVEDAMARGYGSTAAERVAFEEVTRLYDGSVDVDDVLESLLRLMVQRSRSDRAFFAWARPGQVPALVSWVGFQPAQATEALDDLRPQLARLIEEERPLVASDPAHDARLIDMSTVVTADAQTLTVLPFRITDQVEGVVYLDRVQGNDAGTFRSAELALLAMLTNVVSIAAVESERARAKRDDRSQPDLPEALANIVTRNEEMLHLLDLVQRVAQTPARVVIEGETGTGKGLLSTAIHAVSPRSTEPFVQVNCAALPEPLLESELFGHVQGAFTGAVRDKKGLFEEAAGGTIFLDEVDKTSITIQGKLLHVLDRQEVRPVGATKWRKIECRVICATNVDLLERIREGDFLEDLYYRLNEFSVSMPPLRERPEDIMLLARRFAESASVRMNKRPRGFEPELERALLTHPWPGNVRELEKTVERLVVLCENDAPLAMSMLSGSQLTEQDIRPGATLREEVKRLEARLIRQALTDSGWNKLRASKALKLSYPSLLKKIREYGLDRRGNGTRANGRAVSMTPMNGSGRIQSQDSKGC